MSTISVNGDHKVARKAPMRSSVSYSSEDREKQSGSPIIFSTGFWNLTGEQVIMRDRFGLTVIIEPTNIEDRKPTTREFIIFERISVGIGCAFETNQMDIKPSSEASEDIVSLTKVGIDNITEKYSQKTRRNVDHDRVTHRTVIEAETLREGVYVPSVDKVFYLASSKHIYHHPESVEGRVLSNITPGKNKGFELTIEIFDKDGVLGDRWTVANGFPYRITPNRDGIEEDGVRITIRGSTSQPSVNNFELKDANENIGLFKTREEAVNFDPDDVYKRKNLELEKEINDIKARAQREAAENKRTEQFYESDKQKTDHEHYKEKTQYEKDSMRRKNTYEILKLVPAMVTAIATIIIIWNKNKTT